MNYPIGLFDSGIGGLTVFREIARLLPYEDLIYLGDTARLPYGSKSSETILQYSKECAAFLLNQGVKLLVIACHTASSHALTYLQKHLPIPVLGMLHPGIELIRESGFQKIALLGTQSTLASEAYQQLLLKECPEIELHPVACSLFVPLVEEGLHHHAIASATAHHYLGSLKHASIQAALLACTHYPLLTSAIQGTLGPSTQLLEPGARAAKNIQEVLTQSGLLEMEARAPTYRFYTTDHPDRFNHLAALFLGTPLGKSAINKLELNKNLK